MTRATAALLTFAVIMFGLSWSYADRCLSAATTGVLHAR